MPIRPINITAFNFVFVQDKYKDEFDTPADAAKNAALSTAKEEAFDFARKEQKEDPFTEIILSYLTDEQCIDVQKTKVGLERNSLACKYAVQSVRNYKGWIDEYFGFEKVGFTDEEIFIIASEIAKQNKLDLVNE